METGSRRASARDVRDLCVIYGVTGQAQVDELMDLARLAGSLGGGASTTSPSCPLYSAPEQEAVVISAYWACDEDRNRILNGSASPPTREPADTAVTRSAQSSAMMHQMQLCRFGQR